MKAVGCSHRAAADFATTVDREVGYKSCQKQVSFLSAVLNHNHNHKFTVYSAEHCSHCTKKTKHQEKKEKTDRYSAWI